MNIKNEAIKRAKGDKKKGMAKGMKTKKERDFKGSDIAAQYEKDFGRPMPEHLRNREL